MPQFHRETPEGPILEIHMRSGELACWLCGAETEHRWGVPTFNGDLVSNDFPDDLYASDGGNEAVCERCHIRHAAGMLPTWDHLYVYVRQAGFVDGGGI